MNLSEKSGEIIFNSSLPLWIILIPLISAFLLLGLRGKREKFRQIIVTLGTALPFGLVLLMYPTILSKGGVIEFNLPRIFMGVGLRFFVDPMSLLFATITSFVWMIASIYSINYMQHYSKLTRYYFFFLLTLSANLGVVLTNDLFSLFLFFEGLGLFAYPLIIHTETAESFRAGTKYLVMTIVGGLTLLLGIFLLYSETGSLVLSPALENLEHLGYMRFVIAGLVIAGFGVKAGMIPLHTWLPDAHPIAPAPASALLSGIMIKAGAYGIIRVVSNIFRPPFALHNLGKEGAEVIENLWTVTSSLGYGIIWIGITTLFLGALMALLQRNAKRLLAYSSISQMGYILMGVGAAAYLGHEGSLGFAASMYHITNHALFKATLFLVAGAVYFRTHELDIYKLGGLARKMPLVFTAALIAGGGIIGFPLFNGFASKTLLHEAIAESYKYHHLISLKLAEYIFTVGSGITLAYIFKLIYFTFIRKSKGEHKELKKAPGLMALSLLVLAGFILSVGIFPNLLLKNFLLPLTESLRLPSEELAEISFFTLTNITGALPSWIIGLIIFALGIRYGFVLSLPRWLSIDYWYLKLAKIPPYLSEKLSRLNDILEERLSQFAVGILSVAIPSARIGSYLDHTIFSLMVDMWLPRPITLEALSKIHAYSSDIEKKTEESLRAAGKTLQAVDTNIIDESLSAVGRSGEKTANKLHEFDEQVVDRLVNGVGSLGLKLSQLAHLVDYHLVDMVVIGMAFITTKLSQVSGAFDKWVIDGIVNWAGRSIKGTGDRLRPTQTGQVQSYGVTIILGASLLLLIVTIFVYFFR